MQLRRVLSPILLFSFLAAVAACDAGGGTAEDGLSGRDVGLDTPSVPGDVSLAPDVPSSDIAKPDGAAPEDTAAPPDVAPPECDSDDDCVDDDTCTSDRCEAGACIHAPLAGFCHIEGACHEAGAVDPENPCMACVPAVDAAAWTPDDTLPCGDDDTCTTWACVGGACVASPRLDCDDGNRCTEDRCDPEFGCAHRPASGPCDDGNRCTVGDQCLQGLCTAGGERHACDDGNPCTEDECSPDRGCVYTPTNLACDDGDACTTSDRCQDDGVCRGNPTVRCDDGNPCTDDVCHPARGCVHVANDAPCDDGDPCNGIDRCVGRVCVPGGGGPACDDGDPCTDDFCTPGVGCEYAFNDAPCDDGSVCTTGDRCQSGVCRGTGGIDCDDGDPCTLDTCDDTGGCVHEPLGDGPCDDGRVCTEDDRCDAGVCAGTPIVCDDGNGCTLDRCAEPNGCRAEITDDPICALAIVVTEPARGVALTAAALQDGAVPIRGYVESPADPDPSLTLNGQPVALTPAGPMGGPPNPDQPRRFDFSLQQPPAHAMNLLRFEATDGFGRTARRTQSFYYSTVYTPVTAADFAASRIPAGIAVGLAQAFVDDDDATLDDLASLVDRIVATLDLMALVPSPVSRLSQLGCTYDIYLTSASFGGTDTDLSITNDGIALDLTLSSLDVRFRMTYVDGGFWCPGTQTGRATATAVDVTARLVVEVVDGEIQAALDPSATNATMRNLNVTIDSWFLDLVVGFFEGTIRDMLETEIENALRDEFEPLLASVFDALLLDVDIPIPSLFPGGQTAIVSLRTAISGVEFATDQYMKLELDTAILAPRGVPYDSPGALGYANCLRTPFTRNHVEFGTYQRINMGLFDDVANQILHGAWTTGAFELTLGPDVLPADQLAQYGVSDLDVSISLLLPPVLTACKTPVDPDAPADAIVVEMGDMRVDAAFALNGAPVELELYASLTGAAVLGAATNADGQAEVAIRILGFDEVATDLVAVQAADQTTADLVTTLIDATLVPMLLEQLDFTGPIGFALPTVDLSNPEAGIPAGTAFAIQPTVVYRSDDGNTIAKGTVAPPN